MINKAFKEEIDPLNLREDLQNWNKANPNAQITEDEFLEVVCLAFSMHGLGNIARGVKVDEKGNLKPDYLDGYTAEGAEERSVQIAEEIINSSGLDNEKKSRYLPFIKHLIEQTTFQPTDEDKNKPFATFVRVVDQIRGNLFNHQKTDEIVFGLIEESVFEKGGFEFNPYSFFNFVNLRLPELVGEEKAKMVFEAFEKEPPPIIKVENKQITIKRED